MNKKLLVFGIPVLALGFVMAAVLIANLGVTATVSEAISTTETDVTVNPLPGGVTCDSVEIVNDATWDLWTSLSFTELSNVDLVVYTTDLPKTVTLAPGSNMVDVCFDVTEDSPTGVVGGTVTIERVAAP